MTAGPWSFLWLTWVALALFAFWFVRRAQAGAALNNRGLTQLHEGRVFEALASFERAQRQLWRNPLPHYNRGVALFFLWRLDEGRDVMDRATRSRMGKALRIVAVPTLFLIAALQEDADRAAGLDAEVKALGLTSAPLVLVARAVQHARAKRWDEALRLLGVDQVRPLGGNQRALAEALRSWCQEQLGQRPTPVDVVGVFGEAGPQALQKAWPDFADFLARAPRW